jgi:hypothetical protein
MDSISSAAKALARRSVEARRKKWGGQGFRQRMRMWGKKGGKYGKLGGRPPKKEGKQ